jgi:hypothetical protein
MALRRPPGEYMYENREGLKKAIVQPTEAWTSLALGKDNAIPRIENTREMVD